MDFDFNDVISIFISIVVGICVVGLITMTFISFINMILYFTIGWILSFIFFGGICLGTLMYGDI